MWFRYFSNLLSSHLYNIFAIYFPGNSPFLKSLSSAISNFFCFLISAFNLSSNSATTSFVFSEFSSLSQLSCSAINPFYLTKYFIIPLIFLLSNIFSTFHSLTSSIFTNFTSSTFCIFTCFLYHTIQLTFTTEWILIEMDSCNLTILVDTTFLIRYKLIYQFANFFASHSLNTESFTLNITLLPFFHSSTSLLSVSACYFISFCVFLNIISGSFCTFLILFVSSIAFSIFYFSLCLFPFSILYYNLPWTEILLLLNVLCC